MTLKDTLKADLTAAMKSGDTITRDAIRQVIGDINSQEKGGKTAVEFDDQKVLSVIRKAQKDRLELADGFAMAGRPEAEAEERAKAAALETYIPSRLSEDEVRAIVAAATDDVDTANPANFGKVMKAVQTQVAGRFDGKQVAALVNAAFGR